VTVHHRCCFFSLRPCVTPQGWIRSVDDVTFQDERLEATDAYPVELKMTPQGFV
jgi:hypothetical protein